MISRTAVSGSSSRRCTSSSRRRSSGSSATAFWRCVFARDDATAKTSPARFLRRRSSRPFPSSRNARCSRIFSQSVSTFSPRSASVRTIGGFQCALAVERQDRPHLVQHRLRSGVIALVDRDHVRDLHDPRLERLHRVARPGHQHEQHGVGDADHLDLALPGADGLEEEQVLARTRRARASPGASPPRGRRGGRACPSSG